MKLESNHRFDPNIVLGDAHGFRASGRDAARNEVSHFFLAAHKVVCDDVPGSAFRRLALTA